VGGVGDMDVQAAASAARFCASSVQFLYSSDGRLCDPGLATDPVNTAPIWANVFHTLTPVANSW
jgi:hypothetical protein